MKNLSEKELVEINGGFDLLGTAEMVGAALAKAAKAIIDAVQ